MIPLLDKCSVRFVLNHEAFVVEWFKTRNPEAVGSNFTGSQKLIFQILFLIQNFN